jgi:diguanylate cyclase (GGDEF)-like protein/PAS domain S-box-containing protein
MSLILIISILIRLAAVGWSIVLLRQIKDWRMGFLTIMLSLMALRQILTLLNSHEFSYLLITWKTVELPGLIVSILALLFLYFLKQHFSERKLTEATLQESNARFIASFEHAPIGMVISFGRIIVDANEAFCEMLGYLKDELIGMSFNDITHPDDINISLDQYHKLTSGEIDRYQIEKRYIHKQRQEIWCLLSVTLVREKDTTVVSHIQDITERKQADEKLTYQASHDALTGLVNRREFEIRTTRLLSTIKEDKSEHAMCYMDLDMFKVVNDTCGHIAGDELLRQLSSLLLNTVRHRDTLARLGGDEFGVLMEHCSLDDAHRVATALLKAIQDYHFSWEGKPFKVGVSIGLVAINESINNLSELMKAADAACYVAKDKGRNRIHIYHAEDIETAKRHGEMQWVTRIQQAFEENRFCLYAQSIVSLTGSTEIHYELLLRLIDEKGKIIPPGAFLPAAERYNLIVQLDSWVIEKAFTLLSGNPAFLRQINFCSINLSGKSLTDKVFLDFVISQLDESGIEGNKICFEITETAAISNLSTATTFISRLKELGCRFALDDFGSGLSSFGYLKNIPVDYLKIDGMFVKDIVDDPIDHAMVKSINDIGHVMGMQTIAEFVENDEIKGMLREIGVDYAQGYGIHKPQSFDEILSHSKNTTDS